MTGTHPPPRLERLFRDHHGVVLAYAARRTTPPGDLAAAEDVAAVVFHRCWQRLDDVPDDALPWLLATARFVLSETARQGRRRRDREDRTASDRATAPPAAVADHASGTADALAVRAALARLSADDRELVTLVVWDDLPLTGAAAVLGITPEAARTRWRRARLRLARDLGEDGAPVPLHPPLTTPVEVPR